LNGFEICSEIRPDGTAVTMIAGVIVDEAALRCAEQNLGFEPGADISSPKN
jgi:hypothetical protein